MPNIKVSAIIPTFNSWFSLKYSIDSLYKQTLKISEIIVVDNASSDDTVKNVKKIFPKIKLVKIKKNTGVTGGRNAGIEASNKDSQYLLFFDHDMVADKKMLEDLIRVGESNYNFGILTPKIFYFENKKRVWAAGTNINLWTGQVLFRGGMDHGQFENIEEVQVAPAVILVKREVIKRINKFDERYFATYEDTDFCFRARRFNFKTVYVPKAIAFHKISPFPKDEKKRLLSRSFWIGRNRVLFMRDFGRNFFLFLLFSPVYLLYFIKMSLEEKDLKSLLRYIKGYITGILEVSR